MKFKSLLKRIEDKGNMKKVRKELKKKQIKEEIKDL
jgi:hypothetical protein